MIQRIQTVFLFLALCCCGGIYYFPAWQASHIYKEGMDIIGARYHPFLLLAFVPLPIFHLITIFLFRKRKLQMRFCNINIFLLILFIAVAIFFIQTENNLLQHFNASDFRLGMILPFIGIILNMMAKRGIKKDQELIQSMDRLR